MMKNGKTLDAFQKESSNIDIKEMMDYYNISIKIENNETNFYMDNEKISEEDMQSKEASIAVSTVGGKAQNENLFITADLEERVRRKCIQYNEIDIKNEIRENIIKRDKLQEEAGFYKLSPSTIVIDVTNCKSAQESTKLVLEKINLLETV